MSFCFSFFFFLVVLGLELSQRLHLPALYCEGFFDIGSSELFAWVGFGP
jgi:hypothetical protein